MQTQTEITLETLDAMNCGHIDAELFDAFMQAGCIIALDESLK